MRILSRYFLKEFLPTFILFLLFFSFLFLSGNFLSIFGILGERRIALASLMKLTGYLLIVVSGYTIPISLLAGTITTFGRLASDNELEAVKTSGSSLSPFFLPAVLLSLLLTPLLGALNHYLIPRVQYASSSLLEEAGLHKPESLVREGTFTSAFKGYRLYVGKVKGTTLYDLILCELKEDGSVKRTINARRGKFVREGGNLRLKLEEGTIEEVNEENPQEYYRHSFLIHYLDLGRDFLRPKAERKPREITTPELISHLKDEKKSSSSLSAEINTRWVLTFSSLVFVLLGIPLGMRFRKGGKSTGLGMSLPIILSYYLLSLLGKSLGQFFPPFAPLLVWLPIFLMGGAGIFLFLRVIK